MNNFLENFYGILFSPLKTFDELKEKTPLFQGFLIVLFISIIGFILNFEITDGISSLVWLGFGIFFSAFAGVVSWLFFASFLEMLASIFNQSGKIRTFLTLSAFALIPWLFLAPVNLLKTGGILGGLFGILLGFIIWLWVTILIITAIIKTYELSFVRTLTLITVPFFGGFLAFYWFIGFFSTLSQIIKF